ncbi:MAG: hypothetical protein ACR2ID_03400 [Chthoniobacterales bacterium]
MSSALKWRLVIGFILVFIAGGATGLFAGAWHARHAFVGRHGGRMAERMRAQMHRQLDLSPEQTAVIDPIVDRMAARLQEIRRESSRRVVATMDGSHREIATHLTPGQQRRLEQMEERHLRRMHARGGQPPPPPEEQ